MATSEKLNFQEVIMTTNEDDTMVVFFKTYSSFDVTKKGFRGQFYPSSLHSPLNTEFQTIFGLEPALLPKENYG